MGHLSKEDILMWLSNLLSHLNNNLILWNSQCNHKKGLLGSYCSSCYFALLSFYLSSSHHIFTVTPTSDSASSRVLRLWSPKWGINITGDRNGPRPTPGPDCETQGEDQQSVFLKALHMILMNAEFENHWFELDLYLLLAEWFII